MATKTCGACGKLTRPFLDHKWCGDLLVMARKWTSTRGEEKLPPKFTCHLNHDHVKGKSKNHMKDNLGAGKDPFLGGPSEPGIRLRSDR